MHDSKRTAIRDYLSHTFAEYDIQHRIRTTEEDFTINREGGYYKLIVKRTFLETHTAGEIRALIEQWDLAASIRKAETSCVMIGNGGPSVVWS